MIHSKLSKGFFALGIVSLIAAGCPTVVPKLGVQPKPSVGSKQGFGKLPSLTTLLADSSAPGVASRDLGDGAIASTGVGVAAPSVPTMMRPIPYPYPQPHPVTVEYLLEGAMPTWGSEGDVMRASVLQTDPSTLIGFGSRVGVPSAVLNGATQLTSFSVQWQDADKMQWGLNSGTALMNFWKNISYQQPNWKTFPTFQKEELIGVAKSFLLAHGFDSVAAQTPDIQEWPQILPMMGKAVQADGVGMPCRYYEGDTIMNGAVQPMMGGATVESAPSSGSVSADTAVSPNIYPYPCGGWSPQVTLVYSAMQDGKKMTDVYGNAVSNATLTISLASKEVMNGTIQLNGAKERSAYPLIDAETAKRRLQSGGRNPVYAYGEKNIVVHLKSIELVWMRYDSWQNGTQETYDLPALQAIGTVDRGTKELYVEDFRTLVPLLKDDVFAGDGGNVPVDMWNVPYPMMYGGSGGGSVGALKK